MRVLLMCLCIAAFAAAIPLSASGATWLIRPDGTGDAATIQDGVNAAASGDSILLDVGTFTGVGNRDVDLLGKSLTIVSVAGAAMTIVDCQGMGGGFIVAHGETGRFYDITIKGALAGDGAGIRALQSTVFVTDCVITGCNATFRGGGIHGKGASIRLLGTTVTECSAGSDGAGVYIISGSSSDIRDCLITNNLAGGNGGGAFVYGGTLKSIRGNVICGNGAGSAGGGLALFTHMTTLASNTVTENFAPTGGGVYLSDVTGTIQTSIFAFSSQGEGMACAGLSVPTVSSCDIWANAGGNGICAMDGGLNIFKDPRFCGVLGSRNYELRSDSPCFGGKGGVGNPCGCLIGAKSVGCGVVPTHDATWGQVKDRYADD